MNFWICLGLFAQFLFFMRFVIQWIASERRKKSVVPIQFWYLSLIGGILLLIYSIYRKDIVFIIGQGSGCIVYIRNLMLIYKKNEGK